MGGVAGVAEVVVQGAEKIGSSLEGIAPSTHGRARLQTWEKLKASTGR
jgi:hypothetical protein